MVFMCLLLSVFSTIEQYEEVAGIIVYYLVSPFLAFTVCIQLKSPPQRGTSSVRLSVCLVSSIFSKSKRRKTSYSLEI